MVWTPVRGGVKKKYGKGEGVKDERRRKGEGG